MRTLSLFRPAVLAVIGGLLFACVPAFAVSVINLDTGTDILETLEPGGSGSVIFRLSNDGTSPLNTLTGWNLGLQFIPRVGTTGTLTVGSLSAGSVNPVPAGTTELTQHVSSSLGAATINGLSTYFNTGAITTSANAILAAGSTYDMGTVGLTASADAGGLWDVYAIQQDNPLFRTYLWNSGLEQTFANVPNNLGNYAVQLGAVEVVPEPSTLAMLGFAGLGAGGYAWRRRGRRLAVAGGTIVA